MGWPLVGVVFLYVMRELGDEGYFDEFPDEDQEIPEALAVPAPLKPSGGIKLQRGSSIYPNEIRTRPLENHLLLD